MLCVQQHPYVQVIGSLAFVSRVEDTSGEGGIFCDVNLTSVRIPLELTCFSSTTMAALSAEYELCPKEAVCAACVNNVGQFYFNNIAKNTRYTTC